MRLPDGLIVYRIEGAGPPLALLTYVPSSERRLPDLTPAERDVLHALLAGKGNARISAERGTAARTVANQVARIFKKMGVRSRAELAMRWLAE